MISTLITLGNVSIMLCAYVFPDGKFVPRWICWLALAMLAYWAFLYWVLDGTLLDFILLLGFALSTVAVQAYRYRYASNPQQRQQTK